MITIQNTARTGFVVNLLPGCDYGDAHPTISVSRTEVVVTPDGPGTKTTERELPGSISWLAGETLDVHENVREIPAVKRALAAGALRVIQP
jgi:hypothetical protein